MCPPRPPQRPTLSVRVSFAAVAADGTLRVNLRRFTTAPSVGDALLAFDPVDEVAVHAVVARVNLAAGLAYLAVDSATFHDHYAP